MYKTDKKDITEYGPDAEVAYTLASKVLNPTSKDVKIEGIKRVSLLIEWLLMYLNLLVYRWCWLHKY